MRAWQGNEPLRIFGVGSGEAARDAAIFAGRAQAPGTHDPAAEGVGLYQLLVESVQDYAIFALDAGGNILSWKAGAERLKGYARDEIVGRHFSVFYPPRTCPRDGRPGCWLRRGARRRVEDEGWRVRRDGTGFWADVVITALHDERGELVGYAKVTRDLTERRQAEVQAIDAARRAAEAESANAAKSQFLAAMSHDLRTPLNAIGGYAELLEVGIGGPVTEVQRGYLAKIQRSQRHLLGIINDLLNFSRIEAGQIVYRSEPVPLRECIDAIASMLEQQADERGITLAVGSCLPTSWRSPTGRGSNRSS